MSPGEPKPTITDNAQSAPSPTQCAACDQTLRDLNNLRNILNRIAANPAGNVLMHQLGIIKD